MVNRIEFSDPDARSRKQQRDLAVVGALAAQNAVKGKAPLALPQPAPAGAPPGGSLSSPTPGGAPMPAPTGDPLAAIAAGTPVDAALGAPSALTPPAGAGAGGANPLGPGGIAPTPVPAGGAPMTPAFATGGAMGMMAPPMGAAPMDMAGPPGSVRAAGAPTAPAEPRIDLPAPPPPATVAKSPEPYELDPDILTADRLVDFLRRFQQGENPNQLIAEASRPRTRLQTAPVTEMGMAPPVAAEPPAAFVQWLAATKPDDTEGAGRTLVDIYRTNPDTAGELWAIVQSGLTSEERDNLPDDLKRALRTGTASAASGRLQSGRLSLPRSERTGGRQRGRRAAAGY